MTKTLDTFKARVIFTVLTAATLFFSAVLAAEAASLERGMYGEEVRQLQQILNTDPDTAVAVSGPGSKGNETTYFGPATEMAVKKFQQKYLFDVIVAFGYNEPTGIVGPATVSHLLTKAPAGELAQFNIFGQPATVPPTCKLAITPTVIARGQSATLEWAATAASRVVFTQGVLAESGAKQVITPTATTTYTMTVTGINGQTVNCTATVGVTTPATIFGAPFGVIPAPVATATPTHLVPVVPTPPPVSTSTPVVAPVPPVTQPVSVPTTTPTPVSSSTTNVINPGQRYPDLLPGQAVVKIINNESSALVLAYQKNPKRSRDCDPLKFSSRRVGSILLREVPGKKSNYLWQLTDTPTISSKNKTKPTIVGYSCQEVIGMYTVYKPKQNIPVAGTYTVKVGDSKGLLASSSFKVATTNIDFGLYYKERDLGKVTAVDATVMAIKDLSVALGIGLQLEGSYYYHTTNGADIEIDWGDGQKETIKQMSFVWMLGAGQVYSNHTYQTKGNYEITVTVSTAGGPATQQRILGTKKVTLVLPATTQVSSSSK